MAATVLTGRGPDPLEPLADFEADVTHVHNLFPNFGERWLEKLRGPLVVTLHNYRAVCANGLFYRSERVCTECVDGGSWHAVLHSCYRGSRLATLPLAVHNHGGLARNRLVQRADAIILPSDTALEVLEPAGLPVEKCHVIPNGLEDVHRPPAQVRSGFVSVGRYSAEKGLEQLLKQWPAGERLELIGAGPLHDTLLKYAVPGVSIGGLLDREALADRFQAAEGLLMSSVVYESAVTNVVVESFRASTPVIARTGNAAARYVEERGGGVVYGPDSDLLPALEACRGDWERLSGQARANFERDFALDVSMDRLVRLYEGLL